MSEWNDDILSVIDNYTSLDLALLVCDNDKCTDNSRRIPTEWCDDISTSYLLKFRCIECNAVWNACKQCVLKKKLVKINQIRSHKWKYHERKRKSSLDINNNNTNKMLRLNEAINNENRVNGNDNKSQGT
jgi:hypothetical protein